MTHSPTKEAHGLALVLKPDTRDHFFAPSDHPSMARYRLGTTWEAPTGGSMDDPWGNPDPSEVPF